MPFNSNTYHANMHERKAREQIAEANWIRARVAAGTAYEWEAERPTMLIKWSRSSLRLSRSYRSMNHLDR
jgi:hypothetical protein